MEAIELLTNVLLLAVAGIGLVRYHFLTKPFKIIAWSAVVTIGLAILSKFCAIRYRTNAPISHLEAISGIVFFAMAYYYLFSDRFLKSALLLTIVLISVFFVINAIWIQPIGKSFPSNVNSCALPVLATCSLLLFNQMLKSPLKLDIIKQSVFWFNIGVLFYSTTMFLNFGLANYYSTHMVKEDSSLYYFWQGIIMIFNAIIGLSLLLDNNKSLVKDGD